MKKWQIENSEISEILFRVFLFPNFRFCPTAKTENSDLKISEKNLRVFRDFRVFVLAVNNSNKKSSGWLAVLIAENSENCCL